MPNPDADRLRHMRDAAAAALQMAAHCERADLTSNAMLAMALTRCLEVLGEAASRISRETRVRFPAIPFAQMISMRNRLIHAYFDVDLDIVWTTIKSDLPALLPTLDKVLADMEID